MNRWIDVNPYQWFYRDVLDATRLNLDPISGNTLFDGMTYNAFVTGKGRIVKSYVSTENQIEFALPGYVPSTDNPVIAYVEGIPTFVETEVDKVFMPNPLSAGLEVVLIATGVPKLTKEGCRLIPYTLTRGEYPSADLSHKSEYVFDFALSLNEVAMALGRKVKRIQLYLSPGQSVQDALYDQVYYKTSVFAIVNGTLYTSYDLNNIPVTVEYNYRKMDGGLFHTSEKVIPTAKIVGYNDRFFPDIVMTRSEFLVTLQRIRKNLYNRFTDREYQVIANNERNIKDLPLNQWYSEDCLDMLNEKFLDGCYVFPLYEDYTFNPEGCITRAEAVVYLHRFIEWALERYR
ncbi:hypothetical protein [Brevibacillus laterosporus]|uniref:hypothetical protein n=1 Tax=Brevibacillus laterosporus TaxID=1465 RepID=UPI003D1BFD87